MKRHIFLSLLGIVLLNSCAILRPPTVVKNESLDGYKYVYVMSTSDKSSVYGVTTGGVYTGYYGGVYGNVVGSTGSRSVNPAELISGHFIKRGFIRLPEIDQKYLDKTIVVNYSETGRRQVGFGYTIEVTIQIIDAVEHKVLCVGTAEGQGSTETDDVRVAIDRCMEAIFAK